MPEETPERVTIAEAARLLGVHPNTVRTRIKQGIYPADKVLTANGEAYMIPRAALQQDTLTPPYQAPGIVPYDVQNDTRIATLEENLERMARLTADQLHEFLATVAGKDRQIAEQAEEVGRLRERLEATERELARARRRRWPWSR